MPFSRGKERNFSAEKFLPHEASAAALKVPTGDTRRHTSPQTPILSSKDFILFFFCWVMLLCMLNCAGVSDLLHQGQNLPDALARLC